MTDNPDDQQPAHGISPTTAGYPSGIDPAQLALESLKARIAPAPPAPERIGGYKIIGKLGEGGMGVVYRAVQLSLDRTIALKVVRSDLARKDAFMGRFLREAKVAARIDHPNVVTIYDTGEADGHLYMALQYVPGGDVSVRFKDGGTMGEDEALRITVECARGLRAIHQAGLVHRDIKPSNIFLAADGTAKVGDLGLARHIVDDDKLTFTGDLVGTPSYMAPEQARGEADLDHRADLYSLGASLYHLLAGQPPFHGSSPFLIGHQVIAEAPPDPRDLNRAMSPGVAAVIHRAMRKERSQRYQSADEMIVDLELVRAGKLPRYARVTEMVEERRATLGSLAIVPATDGPGRRLTPMIVALGMVMGVAGALIVGLSMSRHTPASDADQEPAVAVRNDVPAPAFPVLAEPPPAAEPAEAANEVFLAENRPLAGELPEKPEKLEAAKAIEATPAEPKPTEVPAVNGVKSSQVQRSTLDSALPRVGEAVPSVPALPAVPAITSSAPVVVAPAAVPVAPPTPQPVPSEVAPHPAPAVLVTPATPATPANEAAAPVLRPAPTPAPVALERSPSTPARVPAPPASRPTLQPKPASSAVVPASIAQAVAETQRPLMPTLRIRPPWASALGADKYGNWAELTVATVALRFRLCPGGPFLMGSPADEPGRQAGEALHRNVIAQPYWLAETECTQRLWRTVMGDNPSSLAGEDLPVDNVAWQRAQEFLVRLNARAPQLSARLPNEAEWEAACRAGSRGPYSGGLDLKAMAWFDATADGHPLAVAAKHANALGLFDIHGNVWEWCQDAARDYPPEFDGLPSPSHAFVFRGGSFAEDAATCRAAMRGGNQTGDGFMGVGFRIAASADAR